VTSCFGSPDTGHGAAIEKQQRITFNFAGDREVQYLPQLPEVGDLVSHRGELWVVETVEEDDAGTIVTCVLPRTLRT